jgi:hypothetical protein
MGQVETSSMACVILNWMTKMANALGGYAYFIVYHVSSSRQRISASHLFQNYRGCDAPNWVRPVTLRLCTPPLTDLWISPVRVWPSPNNEPDIRPSRDRPATLRIWRSWLPRICLTSKHG